MHELLLHMNNLSLVVLSRILEKGISLSEDKSLMRYRKTKLGVYTL